MVLGLPAGALAHGDGPSHYLESESLYASTAPPPPSGVALQLRGYIDAAQRAGYPVKVGLANEGDVTDYPQFVRQPQRYAENVAATLSSDGPLAAPVLIVTPFGVGVAGTESRDGVARELSSARARQLVGGFTPKRRMRSDAMAIVAMKAVRRVATAGGHPLPAKIPPAELPVLTPSESPDGSRGWLPFAVFAAVFCTAALLYEIRARISRSSHTLAKTGETR